MATAGKSRKARNIVARGKASLMVDVRKPGAERGVNGAGTAEVISGESPREINRRIHQRYLSADAIADPSIGAVFASFDDVTIKIMPGSWVSLGHGNIGCRSFWGTPGNDARTFASAGLMDGSLRRRRGNSAANPDKKRQDSGNDERDYQGCEA